MAVLNGNLSDLPHQWAKEFRGRPEKQLLPVATKLCKRVTAQADYNPFSEWWVLKTDWDAQAMRAKALGASPADLARAQQAVRNDWQVNLEQIVFGQLKLAVYGWVGRARWQPLNSSDAKVVLIGGGQQICIPNLTSSHLRVLHSLPCPQSTKN